MGSVAAAPGGLYGGLGSAGLGLLVALLVLAAALLLTTSRRRGEWLRSRVGVQASPGAGDRRASWRKRLGGLFAATERTLARLRGWKGTGRLLERADVPLRTVEFFWLVTGSSVVVAGIACLVSGSVVGLPVGLVLGPAACYGFLHLKARRRLAEFDKQLPDVLVTLAASLRAGHSLKHGLQAVSEQARPPVDKELKRVMGETRLGRSLDDALAAMNERVPSAEMEFLLAAIAIQQQAGGSLATLFGMVAETVRERQRFARKLKGLTATGRMSARVILALPFFLAVAISAINPSYLSPLFTTGAGHLLLALAIVMLALGTVILRRMVTFRG